MLRGLGSPNNHRSTMSLLMIYRIRWRSSIQRQLQQQREKKRKLDTGIKSAFPQSLLTKLLLSHANPQPDLPELPSPPRSRLGSSPAGSRVVTPLPQRKERLKSGYTPGLTTPSPLPQTNTAPSQPPKPAPLPAANPAPLPPLSSASPRTFTLQHLPSISHHTSTLILTLHPPTHVTLTIRHSSPPTIYTIYPGTQGVTVHNQHYSLPELPWKHLSAFRYARRFVEFVASRTLVATTRVAGDIVGKLWADGRAEVEFRGGVMIRVSASGEASVGRGDMYVYQHHLQKAVEVWKWLLDHPDEPQYQPESQSSKQSGSLRKEVFDVGLSEDEQGWEIDQNTKFVRNVGWCKPDEKNSKWWMRFLDGGEGHRGDSG
ncbi:hypothetical protein EX30DRAFT_104019 [Ascodesmis nigricans]|uniref:Cryptic POLO box 1 (CPB1) domain-containing protein n=1 Tax=Ascodesmis nigricans TaxID=341454 RepID=A0A4S2N4Y1_9PEZI|nr:hypothetical protein EX30DRAFT_104019 [Ascodesmis nigricans]